jgi:hypothetical protein
MRRFSLHLGKVIAALAVVLVSAWGAAPAFASGPSPAPTGALIPVRSTSVQYIFANTNVNIRSGPGMRYRVIERFFEGNIGAVTGLSLDRGWWRVPCPPHSTIGNCFVSADPSLTTPVPPDDPNEAIAYMNTQVTRVRAVANVNIRRGPDTGFPTFSRLVRGRTIAVNGISVDGNWWHVVCPAGAINDNCFISRQYTRIVN